MNSAPLPLTFSAPKAPTTGRMQALQLSCQMDRWRCVVAGLGGGACVCRGLSRKENQEDLVLQSCVLSDVLFTPQGGE